jgi:hypothetical protein
MSEGRRVVTKYERPHVQWQHHCYSSSQPHHTLLSAPWTVMFSGVPNPERHRWEKAGAAKNKKFPQGSSEVYIPPGNVSVQQCTVPATLTLQS